MNNMFTGRIALRYLRGKGSANAVPILSRISMVAIAVSSAAMIVVFSVFNGLESIVKDSYHAFYPDIKISVARGKFFRMDSATLNLIRHMDGVKVLCTVIEDNVIANHSDQQKVITLKGIENDYFNVNNVRDYIVQGDSMVSAGSPNTAIAGIHIINELGLDVNTPCYFVLYYPNPDIINPTADPIGAFQTLKLHPAGVFHVLDDLDNTYVLAPLALAQGLFHRAGYFSSVEISSNPGKAEYIKKQIRLLLGSSYRVETRYEQNRTMYMVMAAEKWAVYAILVLVLLIASFNMIGALSMLVLEKQKDIAILRAMGALPSTVRKIFLMEGILWSLVGGVSGIILGSMICLAQVKSGALKMGGSFLVDAFPVQMQWPDFLLVFVTIFMVGLLTSWFPAIRAAKAIDPSLKSS
jgi:lipoprotein-releasing system permease protein